MHPSLKQFITQYVAVVAAALIPVSFVAFLSMPFDLGGHPGEGRTNAPLAAHFS